MSDTESALQLVAMLGDNHQLKPKLDEFIKRKAAAEAAEKRLADAQQSADVSKQAIDQYATRKNAEIEAAQKQHDEAAAEVARRIDVATAQQRQLAAQKEEIDSRTEVLAKHEADLARREKELAKLKNELARQAAEIEKSRGELTERHERLRAAMAG